MDAAELDRWFVSEVLCHERALRGYLRRACRQASDVEDVLQDTYARTYAAARTERPTHVRAFVFRTARNILIDRARRAEIVAIDAIADIEAIPVSTYEADAEAILSSREELSALAHALDTLPPKCREVVALLKIEGCSQREVVERLGISASTVEKHVSKGLRRLAEALYGEGQPFEGARGRGVVMKLLRRQKGPER